MRFTVIETNETNEKLENLLLSQKQDATGYCPGLDIKEIKEIPGLYKLEYHRGTITDKAKIIRIYNQKFITKTLVDFTENILRKNKIQYNLYENIEIEDPKAKELTLNLPETSIVDYIPR